jgi:phage-related protein
MSWTIKLYTSRRGDSPVFTFVGKLDNSTRAKLDRLLTILTKRGPDMGMPHARYLGSDLFELRVRGQNEVRIFYICVTSKNQVVLLHGFRKRTQKLPEKELQIARNRQSELTEV